MHFEIFGFRPIQLIVAVFVYVRFFCKFILFVSSIGGYSHRTKQKNVFVKHTIMLKIEIISRHVFVGAIGENAITIYISELEKKNMQGFLRQKIDISTRPTKSNKHFFSIYRLECVRTDSKRIAMHSPQTMSALFHCRKHTYTEWQDIQTSSHNIVRIFIFFSPRALIKLYTFLIHTLPMMAKKSKKIRCTNKQKKTTENSKKWQRYEKWIEVNDEKNATSHPNMQISWALSLLVS